jgi:hypothetical protein
VSSNERAIDSVPLARDLKHSLRVGATRFCAGLCWVLTRCIALLDASRKRSRVNRACLQLIFRMRAVLLLLSHRHSVPNWTHTRLLLVLIDPVSAGLWPHVRRNKGLTPMQQFARWIVIRANPMADPAVSRGDLLRILRVFRSAHRKRGPEIQSNPLIKNQSNEGSSKQIRPRKGLPQKCPQMSPSSSFIGGKRL